MSSASLWTDLEYKNARKTRVCLERSRSAPLKLWLHRSQILSPNDPFFRVDVHVVSRLQTLGIQVEPEDLEDIMA